MNPLPRHLVVVLGDQLTPDSAAFDGFDPFLDAVWMAEVPAESEKVWSSKPRILLFLSAMRHFRNDLRERGWTVIYHSLDDREAGGPAFEECLRLDLQRLRPESVVVLKPGEWSVDRTLADTVREAGFPMDLRADRDFFCSPADFAGYAEGRKQLRQEFFYRWMRKRHRVLLEDSGQPAGGQWNFDADNRKTFGRDGPGAVPPPVRFPPDETTKEAARCVERVFPNHPGSLADLEFPVTRSQASQALDDFVANRLPLFGAFQDAMWTEHPFLYHSLLSSSLNLHLLEPEAVVRSVERAWQNGSAPLAAVEGFVRQVLGWREYVRGIYWTFMPEYAGRNHLAADAELPAFYWDGNTPMECLRQCITQTLRHGYAHHIQRLMITGLYALLAGVRPTEVHRWYLAVYVDAVEWVELPNTLGMSQFADGGTMASKPYAATGKYIRRMSNYCAACPFDPDAECGDRACPFTTLYWDFLLRNRAQLHTIPRMKLQMRNLDRKAASQKSAIRLQAEAIR